VTRRLPSLNALRAFEAAARHLSFTKAAEELHVTQAAISHQVKTLEEQLGLPLFRRLNRRLLLTDAGQVYASDLTRTFDGIAEATERIASARSGGSLRISTLPSMAAKWLLPRLSRFRARYPEVDVLVSASHGLVDFRRDDVHLAVRYGKGNYPGLETVLLMDDEIFVVCSPQVLASGPPLRDPEDLKHHTLLHDSSLEAGRRDWRAWLERIGVEGVDPDRGPGFSDSNLILEAVMAGEGVALTRRSLAAADLAAGRLAIPFGPITPATNHYYVVYPRANAELPKVRAFTQWLLDEVAADRSAGRLTVAAGP
jgi:LysR family transcriptional regulator, glycine cleavage system transcriptional activator